MKETVGETCALPAAQAEQISGRCPDSGAEAADAFGLPDLLDPAILRTMPPLVAIFMLYEAPIRLRGDGRRL